MDKQVRVLEEIFPEPEGLHHEFFVRYQNGSYVFLLVADQENLFDLITSHIHVFYRGGIDVLAISVHDHVLNAISDLEISRSEERRVGKECVSTCRSRWSPSN